MSCNPYCLEQDMDRLQLVPCSTLGEDQRGPIRVNIQDLMQATQSDPQGNSMFYNYGNYRPPQPYQPYCPPPPPPNYGYWPPTDQAQPGQPTTTSTTVVRKTETKKAAESQGKKDKKKKKKSRKCDDDDEEEEEEDRAFDREFDCRRKYYRKCKKKNRRRRKREEEEDEEEDDDDEDDEDEEESSSTTVTTVITTTTEDTSQQQAATTAPPPDEQSTISAQVAVGASDNGEQLYCFKEKDGTYKCYTTEIRPKVGVPKSYCYMGEDDQLRCFPTPRVPALAAKVPAPKPVVMKPAAPKPIVMKAMPAQAAQPAQKPILVSITKNKTGPNTGVIVQQEAASAPAQTSVVMVPTQTQPTQASCPRYRLVPVLMQ